MNDLNLMALVLSLCYSNIKNGGFMSDKKKDDEVKSCEINDMDFDDRDNHYFHFHIKNRELF